MTFPTQDNPPSDNDPSTLSILFFTTLPRAPNLTREAREFLFERRSHLSLQTYKTPATCFSVPLPFPQNPTNVSENFSFQITHPSPDPPSISAISPSLLLQFHLAHGLSFFRNPSSSFGRGNATEDLPRAASLLARSRRSEQALFTWRRTILGSSQTDLNDEESASKCSYHVHVEEIRRCFERRECLLSRSGRSCFEDYAV